MNLRGVFFLLGRLFSALAVSLLVPAVVSLLHDGSDFWPFVLSAAFTGLAGTALWLFCHQEEEFPFGRREAFLLVSAAWLAASLAGALPWVFFKGPGFFIDAFFESASGFTTTGASILTNIEGEPQGLLLWRSLTQWLGGMGIIVLGIAILPKLEVGGIELLGAEATGPVSEKLTPRIAQTAKALWGIYAAFTLVEAVLLWLLGMTPLEAVNHAFTTMATGGFSTENESIAGFHSEAIEWTITIFMGLAGINFALHFQFLRGRLVHVFEDEELRLYLTVCVVASMLLTADLVLIDGRGWMESIRLAAFQGVGVITTTGFATDDFDAWPTFSKALLFVLFFCGGCAGSTAGSIKVMRILVAMKKLGADLAQLVRPHAVLPVKLGPRTVPEDVVSSVTTFILLFVLVFVIGGLALSLMGLDLVTAFSASATCVTNVGPGFADVGAAKNFADLPQAGKLLLALIMLVGRLELYTVLVLPFLARWR